MGKLTWRRILIPRFSLASLRQVALSILLGALIAGGYGVLHDQVTFTLSSEYFTKFKFQQFAHVDWGLPDRAFTAIIGILSTWWVGAIAGWLLSRIAMLPIGEPMPFSFVLRGIKQMILLTFAGGILGVLYNELNYETHHHFWLTWEDTLEIEDIRAYARVGQIHNFGYLGAVVGLVVAGIRLHRKKSSVIRHQSPVSQPASLEPQGLDRTLD